MKVLVVAAVFALGSLGFAQDIQVNRQNKTIAVTADQSISVDAEVAVIAIGYHNFAATQDAAFQENIRAANNIIRAIIANGVPKANIETQKLRLTRIEPDEKWTPEMKRDRQFEAQQSWNITLSASQAQGIVDLAVKNGSNEVDDVEWTVADPLALQAKASGAALAKAHEVAEQMAKGLGTTLGELVYASNRVPVSKAWRNMQSMTLNTAAATVGSADIKPHLTLFPEKVKSDATVYAVFAIN
jgi:Uncharacterized conserved protein